MKTDYYNEFQTYLKQNNFNYKTEAESKLDDLISLIGNKNDKSEFSHILEIIQNKKTSDQSDSKKYINQAIGKELILRFYLEDNGVQYQLHDDPDILKAVEILSDQDKYNTVLNKK